MKSVKHILPKPVVSSSGILQASEVPPIPGTTIILAPVAFQESYGEGHGKVSLPPVIVPEGKILNIAQPNPQSTLQPTTNVNLQSSSQVSLKPPSQPIPQPTPVTHTTSAKKEDSSLNVNVQREIEIEFLKGAVKEKPSFTTHVKNEIDLETEVFKGTDITGGHKCVLCNQELPSKEELQAHFRRHANQEIDIKGKPRLKQPKIEVSELSTSNKVSSKKGSINQRFKVTDNAVCDVCGEEFTTVSLAISHKFRKHPDSAMKYYCPHCGMMFPIKVNRDHHVKTHPPVNPKQIFPCLACDVSFYNLRALKFHIDSAHKGSSRMISPIDTPAPSLKIVLNNAGEPCSIYYCHLCGCEYQIKYNLQRHLETKHSEVERTTIPEQVVQCNICKAPFYSKRAYEAHNHHHRSSDLYATDEVVRQTLIQRIDQDFDQRRVPSVIERYLSASAVSSNRAATWRNIRAAKQKEEKSLSHSKAKSFGAKELLVNTDSNYVPISSEEIKTEQLEGTSSDSDCALSASGLVIDDHKGVNRFIRGENMCWGEESKMGSKKRMLNDSEEDDCEICSLGLVNPDTVLANSRLMCDNSVDDLVLANDLIDKVLEEKEVSLARSDAQTIDKIKNNIIEKTLPNSNNTQDDGETGATGLVVEKILGVRRRSKGREFLVRWKGFQPADDTWEKEEMLHCVELIVEFLKGKQNTKERVDIEWYAAPSKKRLRPKLQHK